MFCRDKIFPTDISTMPNVNFPTVPKRTLRKPRGEPNYAQTPNLWKWVFFELSVTNSATWSLRTERYKKNSKLSGFFGFYIFHIFRLIGWFSKYYFWNPVQISDWHTGGTQTIYISGWKNTFVHCRCLLNMGRVCWSCSFRLRETTFGPWLQYCIPWYYCPSRAML